VTDQADSQPWAEADHHSHGKHHHHHDHGKKKAGKKSRKNSCKLNVKKTSSLLNIKIPSPRMSTRSALVSPRNSNSLGSLSENLDFACILDDDSFMDDVAISPSEDAASPWTLLQVLKAKPTVSVKQATLATAPPSTAPDEDESIPENGKGTKNENKNVVLLVESAEKITFSGSFDHRTWIYIAVAISILVSGAGLIVYLTCLIPAEPLPALPDPTAAAKGSEDAAAASAEDSPSYESWDSPSTSASASRESDSGEATTGGGPAGAFGDWHNSSDSSSDSSTGCCGFRWPCCPDGYL